MTEKYNPSQKVYLTVDGVQFSILDMLAYFEKYGGPSGGELK